MIDVLLFIFLWTGLNPPDRSSATKLNCLDLSTDFPALVINDNPVNKFDYQFAVFLVLAFILNRQVPMSDLILGALAGASHELEGDFVALTNTVDATNRSLEYVR